MITREQAAQKRAQHVRTLADRPSRRRCQEGDPQSGIVRVPFKSQLDLRAASGEGDTLTFDGYATVYEAGYEMWDWYGPYTEIVSAGAGAASLNRADLDVPLVLQHDQLRRIARTANGSLVLTEDANGLHVLAANLDPTDYDVAYIAPKLRSGLIDEMSFAFRITRGHWSPDYTEYRIDEYDIHRGDVAIVGFGANPHTSGSGLRESDLRDLVRAASDAEAAAILTDLRERLQAPASVRMDDLLSYV